MTSYFINFVKYLFLAAMLSLLSTMCIFAVDKRLDFDGDGKADFVIIRPENGNFTWYVLKSSDSSFYSVVWGLDQTGESIVPNDYDGDGKSDIAIYRLNAGQCYDLETQTVKLMNVFYVLSSQSGTLQTHCWGSGGGRRPEFSQDYDGDGKVDPTYVQHAFGSMTRDFEWKILKSSTIYTQFSVIQVIDSPDASMHSPATGDYDGDGKADAVIVDRTTPTIIHHIKRSSDGVVTSTAFGSRGIAKAVPGDYDGDGKTDIAVKQSSGNSFDWWIINSSNGSITVFPKFGLRNLIYDRAIIGDYDGDGKSDIAVVRQENNPSCGNGLKCFYALGSTSGVIGVQWGLLTDKDLEAEY